MVGHSLCLKKCTSKFHEIDGSCIHTLHQLFCGGIPILHPHIQQNLGGAHATYSIGFGNSSVAQAICQLGKMFLRHEEGPILGLHY
jgi:hypothetical protein